MSDRVCSVEGCGRRHYARDCCEAHYWRLKRTGTVNAGTAIGDVCAQTLPNPWVKVAPPCPSCGSPDEVYLWAADCERRWFAVCCRLRFDVAVEVHTPAMVS